MLTFSLWHSFPPLYMGITSRIIKKKSDYAEKIVCRNVELQATFFVRLVRSLINLWFSTSQTEETNKETKVSRPQSHGDAISMENSLEMSTTLVCLYQQQQQQEQLLHLQPQQQKNKQLQQCYLNGNQNRNDEDLDETNSKPHTYFPLLLHTLFLAINQCL